MEGNFFGCGIEFDLEKQVYTLHFRK